MSTTRMTEISQSEGGNSTHPCRNKKVLIKNILPILNSFYDY